MHVNSIQLNKIFTNQAAPTSFDLFPIELTQKIFLEAADAEVPLHRMSQIRKYSSLSISIYQRLWPLVTMKNLVLEVQERRLPLPCIQFDKMVNACKVFGKTIHYLHFGQNKYSEDETIGLLKDCPNVTEVDFHDVLVTHHVMQTLVSHCSKISLLKIYDAHLDVLKYLREIKTLKALHLGRLLQIEDRHLETLPINLKELSVEKGSKLSSEALRCLPLIESLRIDLFHTFTDQTILDLEKMSQLRSLSLGGKYTAQNDFLGKAINRLNNLVELDLSGLRQFDSENGFLELTKNSHLKKLVLIGSKLNAKVMHEVGKMQGLEKLELTSRPNNISGIYSLSQLKSLDVRDLTCLFSLKECSAKSTLEELTIGNVTDFSQIREYQNLKILKLTHVRGQVTDEHISCLEGLPLRELGIINCKMLTSKALDSIGKLQNIESIVLDNVPKSMNLSFIIGLPKIRFLSVTGSSLTAEDLEILKESKTLENVHIHSSVKISPKEVKSILKGSASLVFMEN